MNQLDKIETMLHEILVRLQYIESQIDFETEEITEDVQQVFDRIFKKTDKTKLTIVRDKTNILDFDKNE